MRAFPFRLCLIFTFAFQCCTFTINDAICSSIQSQNPDTIERHSSNNEFNKQIKTSASSFTYPEILKENLKRDPISIDKYDNSFWRAGATIFYLGFLTLLAVAGLLSITRSKGKFWEWIIIICLGLILLSLPFLLIGWIIGKSQKS